MNKLITLKAYLYKIFNSAVLCQYHYDIYSKINYITMFPLILGASILTVLNTSTLNEEIMKYVNISVNGINTVSLALITNY